MTAAAATLPEPKVNAIGLEKADYKGLTSTLCPGCGHDSISMRIIDAAYQLNIKPHEVIKLSGIGCSSKSPAYFLNGAHGINTVHGRIKMPFVVADIIRLAILVAFPSISLLLPNLFFS